jgi:ParB-like chromosome segregation protein Spo0J
LGNDREAEFIRDIMNIQMTPVAQLVPYAGNARTHSDEQIAQIAASITEFGFTNPILTGADNVIIAGPGRLLAAQKLGIDTVPVIVLDHLSEAQRRALVIADNKLAENAGWDEELLRTELAALDDMDFDLDLMGFSDEEIDSLLGDLDSPALGETEGEDDVPETPEDPVSRPGDLWLLGKHRLLCGDATVATDVERVLNRTQPLLMVTDPPYGVQYDPGWRNQAGAAKTKRTGKVLNDDRADWCEAWSLFPGDVAYVWHGALHATTVAESLEAAGFNVRSQIIWAKDRLVLSRGDYHWQHEPCWYAVKKTGKGHWAGDRKQTTL